MSPGDGQSVDRRPHGRDGRGLPIARRPGVRLSWRRPVLAACMRDRAVALALSGLVTVQLAATAFGVGLWRCPLRQATGIPCPGCGMTQSALAIADFDWYNVWQLNPFAPVLMVGFVLTAVAAVLPTRPRGALADAVEAVETRTGITTIILVGLVLFGLVRVALLWAGISRSVSAI